MSDKNQCGWQGYGFGAPYQDAACCDGTIGDLDDVQGPGLIGLRDEMCPQCGGDGKAGHVQLGPMALVRQRALDQCLCVCDAVADEDVKNELIEHFRGWHGLVNKLESRVISETPMPATPEKGDAK